MCARNRNCYFVFVLVTVVCAARKYLSRINLKEEGFILAGNLRRAILSWRGRNLRQLVILPLQPGSRE